MGRKPRIEPGENKGDKHGSRWKTRRTVRPNVPREKKSSRYIEKYGNKFETTRGTNTGKWETKRRGVSCAQKHSGRRAITGMDKKEWRLEGCNLNKRVRK